MRNPLSGFSSIKTWWKTPLLLGLVALLFASLAGIYSEVASLKHKVGNAVKLWEPDLARAFAADDWLTIKRIGQSFRFDEIETISISSKNSIIYSFPENYAGSDCSIPISVSISRYGYNLGQAVACTSARALFLHALRSPLSLVISFGLVVLLFVTSIIPLIRYRSATLRSLRNLKKWSTGPVIEPFSIIESDLSANDPVLMELMNLVREGAEVRIETEREVSKLRSRQELGLLAAQVAHDIRSPLAALEMVSQMANVFPEDEGLIVRNAIGRINDIANSLLIQNRAHSEQVKLGVFDKPLEEPLSVELLANIVDAIISEKRMQFRAKRGITIASQLSRVSYGLFAEIQAIEFRRMLSNLINNAVEVLAESGEVKLSLVPHGKDKLILCIEDNGIGMSAEIISRLGKRGETYGKVQGSGLGLYHAYQSVEKWHGCINIESEAGKGTKVIVTLPLAKVPGWFISTIKVVSSSTVIVLDNDDSIYELWLRKFQAVAAYDTSHIKILHFSSPRELIAWHAHRDQPELNSALYICDFEMVDGARTGLNIIEQLGIVQKSILVTNSFDHPAVLDQCEELGLKFIPKTMATFVEIEIETAQETVEAKKIRPDAILIDDDDLVHLGWKVAAKRMRKEIRTYYSGEAFLKEADQFDTSTPVYVDSNLKDGVQGQEVAKVIFDLRFRAIYLATGLDPSAFSSPLPYIRGILGKEPPWRS